MVRQDNDEIRKHSIADWYYAREFARALGYADDSPLMKKLLV